MTRAIGILVLLVLGAVGFVVTHLVSRAPMAAAAAPTGPAPLLAAQDDGSIVSISSRLSRFEDRLVEAERTNVALTVELRELRDQRDQLESRVESLQAEVRRLRAATPTATPPDPGPVDPASGSSPEGTVPVPPPPGAGDPVSVPPR